MKRINNLFISTIALFAITACSDVLNEKPSSNDNNIVFTMGIEKAELSRVEMGEDVYNATFATGDKVGIFVDEVVSYTNVEYSYDGTNWQGATLKAPADETSWSYTFYAYYPYSGNVTSADEIPATVSTDQETDGYLKNDFLYAKITDSDTDVALNFGHALSLVEVELTGNVATASSDFVVKLLEVKTEATINIKDEAVTTLDVKNNVIMDELGNKKFRAIIPAQTIGAGKDFLEVMANGRKFVITTDSEINLVKGEYIKLTPTLE